MPRGPNTYTLPPGTIPQVPNTTIPSPMFNAVMADLAQALNTPWPVAIGIGAAGATGSWDAINAKGNDIPTAGTLNLTAASGPNLTVTGTTTVNAVTLGEGNVRFVRANAAFQLTASANLIVNGSDSVNLTTSAGMMLVFIGGGGGITRVWTLGVSLATTTSAGVVELATLAETLAGTSSSLVPTVDNLYFPPGFINGFQLANDTSDATNDAVTGIGACRDSTGQYNIILASHLIKRLDAAWAVGDGNGGLDTGSKANSTWYAVYVIKRLDTGVVDVLYSTNITTPTLPTNYTIFRRIGFIRTDGSGVIRPFKNKLGGQFLWVTPVSTTYATPGATAVLRTLEVPSGLVIKAMVNVVLDLPAGAGQRVSITDPDTTDIDPNNDSANISLYVPASAMGGAYLEVSTNTSAQVRSRVSNGAVAGTDLTLNTIGWYDQRGQF